MKPINLPDVVEIRRKPRDLLAKGHRLPLHPKITLTNKAQRVQTRNMINRRYFRSIERNK